MTYRSELFVTLCVKNTKKLNLSAEQQYELSKDLVINLLNTLGRTEDIVWELTKKGNVHWHAIVNTEYNYQSFWEHLCALLLPGISCLHIPEHSAVKDVWDAAWLKGVYLRKEEHNRTKSNKPYVTYEVVNDSEEE